MLQISPSPNAEEFILSLKKKKYNSIKEELKKGGNIHDFSVFNQATSFNENNSSSLFLNIFTLGLK